jgi:hypothetical protein
MDSPADKEAVAIQSIVSSLAALAAEEKHRVLVYLGMRYGNAESGDSGRRAQPDEAGTEAPSADYADVATLFEKRGRDLVRSGPWWRVTGSN